jgi:XTP/dITP diphosphohydrolase
MEIFYATTNKGKVNSMQREFDRYGWTVKQLELDIPEPRSSDVKEIAEHKIKFAYQQIKKPVIALDAGFYIPSLNGFPRAFVNFSLETVGLEGILRLAEGKSRDCEFREALSYMDDNFAEPKTFIGQVKGTLAKTPRGTRQDYHWSKLVLIFIPEGSDKTLAEMTKDKYTEWRKISREKESPARKFVEWLNSY